MSVKYHVSADGTPGKCLATIRPCPLGDESNHYGSETEAREAFEKEMQAHMLPEKAGFAVVASIPVESEWTSGEARKKVKVKRGFETPDEAIKWAEENISDATHLISLENENYEPDRNGMARKGEWKTLNLIDISPERQALNSKDIPTIAKWYLKNRKASITDVHSMRLATYKANGVLDASELGRLRGYLKAATYGKGS